MNCNMMSIYNFENLNRIINEPSLIPRAIKIGGIDINRRWYNYRYKFSEENIFSEDWDNLIIIDAARYDIFKSISPFSKERVHSKKSPGSYSLGFMKKSFFNEAHHDTVYVSANPYTSKIPDNTFHAVINLLDEKWDEELGTVPPEAVVDSAIEAHNEFPHKRLIIHFMQPHYPFIGEKGKDINSGFEPDVDNDQRPHPWNEQMWGKTDNHEQLIEAYKENHEIAIKSAIEVSRTITGKDIITSDHANLIGERGFPIPLKMYGHPTDFPHPNLLKVPWVEIDGDRRKVSSDSPIESQNMEESVVNDRLDALGYK